VSSPGCGVFTGSKVLGFGVYGIGIRDRGLEFRVWVLGFGFRIWDLGGRI
jgi:hypothetical protein